MKFKRGQVTIFIIIAIIIVALIAGFFLLRGGVEKAQVPVFMDSLYNSFLSCLEEDVNTGISVLESQGGYIELPEFSPGSRYMPFSSQLNFLGNPIPYWYYVSGNGIEKEQVPSLKDMESELEGFIEKEIKNCVLEEYYEQGFEISQGEPKADVTIKNNLVRVNLDMSLGITKADETALVSSHKIDVNSNIGKLYNSALKVYNYEQENLFLEEYGIDTLRIYAPVDGVDFSCSPRTWSADIVFETLKEAIEVNTLFLKTDGEKNDYYTVEIPVEEEVRFLNSKEWANSYEVVPSEGSALIANPVGNQEGLGILGFCYVPYHFVYNVRYPVLVQVYSDITEGIFQFPVAVVIQGNKPREPLDASASTFETSEICSYKNTRVKVRTYDSSLNSIDADIYYECFGDRCSIGQTTEGFLEEDFPQCVNGYIIAIADGFKETKYLHSTIYSGSADIILDKLYEKEVVLKVDGRLYNGKAIINFISSDDSRTVVYPEQKNVELSEGEYEIQAYIYEESSLNLQSGTYEQCIDVASGIGGLFGITKKQCFDVQIPSQIISNVLSGGGKETYYILESELTGSNTVEINAESLTTPKTIEQLQNNYILFDDKGLEVSFR
jgi:hypothetical protein